MPQFLNNLLTKETLGGFILLLATILALIICNTSLEPLYHNLLTQPLAGHSLKHVINDGLMTLFFFQVGLELKRERLQGSLRDIHHILLPSIAALGGVVVPIAIYFMINLQHPENYAGWAIPMATDIAFALSVLALFGKHVSTKMKTFLLTLAIMDDLAAIIVIAIFHSSSFSYWALSAVLLIFIVLQYLNYQRVGWLPAYLILGFLLWFAMLHSGIHATLAGVLVAFCIPLTDKAGKPILTKIEHAITPIVIFTILPIFAFANAGITFTTVTYSSLLHPITLGILLGLLIGKPLGIVLFSKAYSTLAKVSDPLPLQSLLLIGCVAGLGFTMSLLIADLSFQDAGILNLCRLGILAGSLFSVILASATLFFFKKN